MNIKALITTLGILGSSSIAMARPATYTASANASWSFGYDSGPVVRDHRYDTDRTVRTTRTQFQRDRWADRPGYGYDYQPRGMTLAEGLQFGNSEYRKDILVGASAGRFNAIRLDSDGGTTFVKEVRVEFLDGGFQSIQVNRNLNGNGSMTFDLDGNNRPINRIFVYRADQEGLNWRHNGEFSVTVL